LSLEKILDGASKIMLASNVAIMDGCKYLAEQIKNRPRCPNLKIIIHCQSKIATVSYTHISLKERYQIYGIKRA